MKAVAERLKAENRKRMDVFESRLEKYVDAAIKDILGKVDISVEKAGQSENRLGFVVKKTNKLEGRIEDVEKEQTDFNTYNDLKNKSTFLKKPKHTRNLT